jgi:uroporphyrinogen decarboxylase
LFQESKQTEEKNLFFMVQVKSSLAGSAFLKVLAGEVQKTPPVWLMRQAGRYLPEYREIRARAKNFLDFCYTPELAIEATLQPIRRFGFDASIVFSDILVVPDSLGQKVWFVEGEGPRLEALTGMADIARLAAKPDLTRLQPVFMTIAGLKRALPMGTPLIGFCGAPYTVATYMLGGGKTKEAIIRLAYEQPDFVDAVIDRVVVQSIAYLEAQVDAGVDALQLFESWASLVPPMLVERLLIAPVKRIVDALKASRPQTPILAFPRTASSPVIKSTAALGVNAISLDTTVSLAEARRCVGTRQALQGNLDPLLMVIGGEALDRAVDALLEAMEGHPYIANLGHGITPDASVEAVERLLRRIRG